MLILPPGHARARLARPRVSLRERWILVSVLAVVAGLVLVVAISIGSSSHRTGGGCIDVKYPIAIGGEELYRCGASARRLCATTGGRGGASDVVGRAVAAQCRKAELPVR